MNIGGAAGPIVASWVHGHMQRGKCIPRGGAKCLPDVLHRAAALPRAAPLGRRSGASLAATAKNFVAVLSNPRFMLFLLIFSGYWIVFWQEFIILPLYVFAISVRMPIPSACWRPGP